MTAGGVLPYTGAPVAWLALFGAMLLMAGVVLRIELRRRDRDLLATVND
ncbi:MAG: LPXTG cell wall anchor domain-containing protein [Thermoleophilia bacterium]|nr:LPXTG cell wall anchor domain-containing protein [Thermoleophilia bacterium]